VQVATVYICDVGGEGSQEPSVCAARTIVLSSPDGKHYHEWQKLKMKPAVHMPSWSADEVAAVVPTVYPQRYLADNVTSIYPARFQLYGGIARTIFYPGMDDRLETELDQAVNACDIDVLIRSIETGVRLGPLQQLIQYEIGANADGTPDYRTATMNWASDAICEFMMQAKDAHGQSKIVSFLNGAIGKPDLGSMRGKAFEYWTHGVLSRGGTFRLRWESDPTHTDYPIHFPPATMKGIVGTLNSLVAGVRPELCTDAHVIDACASKF
jgi:hypothetical protein